MPSVKSLTRGLRVLAAINDHSPASISQLVSATDLPKATVIRLLQSLQASGYVEVSDNGGGYTVSQKTAELSRAITSKSRYPLAAENVLKELGSRLKWPCELLIRDGYSLNIEAGNRDSAPIKLQIFERRRFPLSDSAAGHAYLAALGDKARSKIIRELSELANTELADGQKVASGNSLKRSVTVARKRGYAVKDYDVVSVGMRVVAIPMVTNAEPIGALSMVHYREYVSETQLDQIILPAMRKACRLIVSNLS